MAASTDQRHVVLVTGGSGLVGRNLQGQVSERKARGELGAVEFVFLSSKDGDLTCYESARALFLKHRPRFVVHLAAKVGGLYANMNDKEGKFYELNSRINENVLGLSLEFKVERCLSCLSTCIFPEGLELPLDETKIHAGPPHESNLGYATAKRQVDLLNKRHNELSGEFVFFSIIPSNIYGPHDNFNPHESHVVPGLIERAHQAAANGRRQGLERADLRVCGSGRPLRQFVFAGDLARLVLWATLELRLEELGPEPSVIASPDQGHEVSIGRVAETIARLVGERLGASLRVCYDDDPSGGDDGQFRKTASNAKLRRLLPEFQFTPLEAGLARTVEWFCANHPHGVRGCK